ncbi:TetR/AcrR family transcriptional regulator [Marinactinospora rubrisoli]|uniref:TetR/AcrR family transcriptional regulator n=1 Tax=Marinactinospora rubrisoli TaxID=2715399 RepID=A0ABW2KF41_9ACTN
MVDAPPLTPAARRVLDAASDLFYREGIHAVGVEAIAAAAGVTKKTLYDRFGSKDRLVAAYLRARDARWRTWLTEYVAARAGDPAAGLLHTFDALGEWIRAENPRGCGFVNALAELPDAEHPGRAIIAAQKRWLREELTALATAAGARDPQALAEQLLLLHEGATIAHGTAAAADPVGRARAAAAVLVEHAVAAEGR